MNFAPGIPLIYNPNFGTWDYWLRRLSRPLGQIWEQMLLATQLTAEQREIITHQESQFRNLIDFIGPELNQKSTELDNRYSQDMDQLKKELNTIKSQNKQLFNENKKLQTRLNQLEAEQKKVQAARAVQVVQQPLTIPEQFNKEHKQMLARLDAIEAGLKGKTAVVEQNFNSQILQHLQPVSNKLNQLQEFVCDKVSDTVFVSCYKQCQDFLSNNAEFLNHCTESLKDLRQSPIFYRDDLLILTNMVYLNPNNGAEFQKNYTDLLVLCRDWKKYHPDGEIHCICNLYPQARFQPSSKLYDLFDSCNSFSSFSNHEEEQIKAIRKFWSYYTDEILS